MKIVDKMQASIDAGEVFFSFEFFPPRTEEGLENLMDRMDDMVSYGPTFCDITWGAGGSTADLTLDIATRMQNMVCVETMMHLTCTNMPQDKLKNALQQAKQAGIQNILALRGDPPKGQENFTTVEGGFQCALDLLKYVRKEHGDYFGIGVAGYPEAHPDSIVTDDPEKMKESYWADIRYLKEKIDAGGEFIITQLFYDTNKFLQFVEDCRSVGIQCPIIPGIMPIMTYGGFKRMTNFCKTCVPDAILKKVESLKDDAVGLKTYGIDLAVEMCQKLLDKGTPGLHMYSLNMSKSVLEILNKLKLIEEGKVARKLPWRAPPTQKRADEKVRPIFWSNRPKSYIKRTEDWDTYAWSRWGDNRSPAYGTLSDYPFMRAHTRHEKRLEKARQAWGESLNGLKDVISVFVKYTKGEIALLPWNEMDKMQRETEHISDSLVKLNTAGYLTINSQPQINGVDSADPRVGWGGKDGVIYQKAYVEFFISPEDFYALIPKIEARSSLSYMAASAESKIMTNMQQDAVNAVTWGVFPGMEIIQPTIVDVQSFLVWKDEAFELWLTEWGSLYEEGSKSKKILNEIKSHWLLVSLVENDFRTGNIFSVFGIDDDN